MAGVKGKSGRKPHQLGLYFRELCREIGTSDPVVKLIRETAERDPIFALRVCEHGFGRPHQAVHVTRGREDGLYVSEFSDSKPLSPPASTILPTGARA